MDKAEDLGETSKSGRVADPSAIIDGWSADLIQNIPTLRETDSYNKFSAAVADLKNKLKQ